MQFKAAIDIISSSFTTAHVKLNIWHKLNMKSLKKIYLHYFENDGHRTDLRKEICYITYQYNEPKHTLTEYH